MVVGGGYTGLSAALHLAETGREVVLLEAGEPGWGASGRNGGQVIAGLKLEPDAIERRFGPALGARLVETAGGAPDEVFALIRRHGIDCDAMQQGWIQAAHTEHARRIACDRARQWEQRGVPVTYLDADAVHDRIGCAPLYCGGWLDPRGGTLQPLSFARGLARAAIRCGARLFAHSRVLRLRREGGCWSAETAKGRVSAQQLILATNGYSDGIWPRLARSVVPAFSQQVATAPLPASLHERVFPHGQAASDTRRLLWYYRRDPEGRLMLGGRGHGDRPHRDDAWEQIEALHALFPETREVAVEHLWAGRVAMTPDHLPHLHVLAPNAYAGLGFNGRGVAMATIMGRVLAEAAGAADPRSLPFPVTRLAPIPLHALRGPLVRAVARIYRYLDARDDAR